MEKNKKIIVFSITFLCCFVYALIVKAWQSGNPFQPSTVLFGLVNFAIALTSLYIGKAFFQKIMNRSLKQVKKIIIPGFIFFIVIILLISFLFIAIGEYLFYLMMGMDLTNFPLSLQQDVPYVLKMYSIWILIASVFFFYIIWRQAIDREQQLREENLKYRYRTLKTQVNPHFLFNSLNTLSEIVYVDAKRADNYIQKLSGIYRYILENEETDSIPLNKELDFVKQYFNLQKERDEEKIRLQIDVKDEDKFEIVPVSLQILVENALKHNALSEEKPLEISIYRDANYIVVINPVQLKNRLNNSPGTGLSNLMERIKLITGKEMSVNRERNIFEVRIPLIRIKI